MRTLDLAGAEGPSARRGGGDDAGAWRQRFARPADSWVGVAWRLLVLALAYLGTGWLGLQLAQPPGYATAIWPPSGISLALLLLWGRGLWPGVWLGSLLLNGAVGYKVGGGLSPQSVLVAVALLAARVADADNLRHEGAAAQPA